MNMKVLHLKISYVNYAFVQSTYIHSYQLYVEHV